MRPLALAALLCMAAGLAAAQSPSLAERASQSERPLTKDEAVRLAASCDLAVRHTGASVDLAGRRDVPVVDLPGLRVLRLVEYRATAAGEVIERYPDLPLGGVGWRDYCDAVVLRHLAPPEDGERPVATFGLRLRPDLDLMADYPTTGTEIARRRQITDLPEGLHALLDGEGMADTVDWDALVRDGPAAIDASRPALVIGPGIVLVPVTDAGAD